jgi:hypothetical protein
MPFLLFLLGAAAVALVASQAKASPKGGGRTYTLDANLPPQLRQQVLAALSTETNPQKLFVFAAQLVQQGYPLSAQALMQRGVQLGGTPPWQPQPAPSPAPIPGPSPAPTPNANPMDPNQLPDPPRTQVLLALSTGTDPGTLPQLAAQMDAQGYTYAATALRAKAALLNVAPQPQPSPAPGPSPMPPPGVLPSPAPSPSPLPTPSPLSLDPGMPPQMQSAVLGALTTETDPAKLSAFAQEIQAQYPIAAGLLMTKALALRGGVAPGPSPAPGGVNAAVVTTHDPPPAGDLKVFDAVNGKQIGGVDKGGTVTVLQWNADGANQWARVAWTGGRGKAVTGYVHQAYLVPSTPVLARAPVSAALVRKGAANGVASHA